MMMVNNNNNKNRNNNNTDTRLVRVLRSLMNRVDGVLIRSYVGVAVEGERK